MHLEACRSKSHLKRQGSLAFPRAKLCRWRSPRMFQCKENWIEMSSAAHLDLKSRCKSLICSRRLPKRLRVSLYVGTAAASCTATISCFEFTQITSRTRQGTQNNSLRVPPPLRNASLKGLIMSSLLCIALHHVFIALRFWRLSALISSRGDRSLDPQPAWNKLRGLCPELAPLHILPQTLH